MEILKIAVEWAKSEVFSARFFVLFGLLFLLGSLGFWQLGKTEMAKAFIVPTLVAGFLLVIIGAGIFFTNKSRVIGFVEAYEADADAFVASEIVRTEKSLAEYRNIVFKAIPLIIVAAALVLLFIDTPLWRAIGITTLALMVVILVIDSNANARIETYRTALDTAGN